MCVILAPSTMNKVLVGPDAADDIERFEEHLASPLRKHPSSRITEAYVVLDIPVFETDGGPKEARSSPS